ncbi:MAG: hypothetical protein GTO22_03850 [Gemmatimonadales bacterium]|nr:hypothetical protein [Gemmatimonadales bacterium]
MVKRNRPSFLKRQRELKKARKAALKRERRQERKGSTLPVPAEEDAEAHGAIEAAEGS